ncbi:hypothetical protein [Candidatus Sarmatiella mevalonica]|uniref:hypothetical protein n=1 Tax=Candidatus Sarmatiella mevalonica TaxID=2770581 RepID=UPI001921D8B8|nr:hypothetical protein [Candidatus Sarmatiella mevalonica]
MYTELGEDWSIGVPLQLASEVELQKKSGAVSTFKVFLCYDILALIMRLRCYAACAMIDGK